jgi:hypothetical protein
MLQIEASLSVRKDMRHLGKGKSWPKLEHEDRGAMPEDSLTVYRGHPQNYIPVHSFEAMPNVFTSQQITKD